MVGDAKYAETHEWARLDEDGNVTVGISQHAQEELGDIVYVELPEKGQKLSAGDNAGVVESVKAASDIYAPVSGKVIATNPELADTPEKINADPLGEGWMYRIKPQDQGEIALLLDESAYQALQPEE